MMAMEIRLRAGTKLIKVIKKKKNEEKKNEQKRNGNKKSPEKLRRGEKKPHKKHFCWKEEK